MKCSPIQRKLPSGLWQCIFKVFIIIVATKCSQPNHDSPESKNSASGIQTRVHPRFPALIHYQCCHQ